MPIYDLINPSDSYTFVAPNIQAAGAAVAMLGTVYGAEDVATGESTPVLFGWDVWLAEHQIDDAWIKAHAAEIADALESFLIGEPGDRAEVDATLKRIPEAEHAAWLAERHDRRRSSMNDIKYRATLMAERVRRYYLDQKASNGPKA